MSTISNAWSFTKKRVPTRRTGQSSYASPSVQSVAVRSRCASAESSAMRMSATPCWTSGWCAIEPVNAIDDRFGMVATVMSKARRAAPR